MEVLQIFQIDPVLDVESVRRLVRAGSAPRTNGQPGRSMTLSWLVERAQHNDIQHDVAVRIGPARVRAAGGQRADPPRAEQRGRWKRSLTYMETFFVDVRL